MINAVGNTLGNSWGLLVPLLSVWCKRRFNSYAPVFINAAVMNLVGGLLFWKYARLHSKAELAEQAGREQAAAKGARGC